MNLLNKMFMGNIRFLIPIAYPEYKNIIESLIEKNKNVFDNISYELLENENTESVYEYSDVLILSSGTSSLIAALYEKPMVICYKISFITYFIAKMFVKGGFIGMPNILLGKSIVPEFLQSNCNANAITDMVICYLTDENLYNDVKKNLSTIKNIIGEGDVIEKVAKDIIRISRS